MPAPTTPFQPYASVHQKTEGPGDARPTALQVVKDCNMIGQLKGKHILITGCSSGLGVETARALYETGASLFLTARDMPKLEKVIDDIVAQANAKDVPRPIGIEMHLDSLDSVRKGAEDFEAKCGGKLNMLIENAGVMACPLEQTKDGLERQVGTNHFAHFLLFQLVKPLLIQSAKESGSTSRVIALSSSGHRMGEVRFDDMHYKNDPDSYQKWASYGQSKTANIYFAASVHRHYGSQGVTSVSLHPGGIHTELGRHLTEEDVAAIGGWDAFKTVFKSVEQGAATTVWAAVSPHFEDVANGGRFCADVGECGPIAADADMAASGYAPHVYNEEKEEKLWKISYDVVGVPADN